MSCETQSGLPLTSELMMSCSYHLNGDESPLIRVVRGIDYTFNVMVRT